MRRKGGHEEQVAITGQVADLLDTYQQQRPPWTGHGPAPLLARLDGRRMDRHAVAGVLARLARKAGIEAPHKVTRTR